MPPQVIKSTDSLQDIFVWDVRNWSRALDFWWPYLGPKLQNADCLEIGAGEYGGLSLLFALGGAARIACTDSRSVSSMVRRHHEEFGVSSGIEYSILDVCNLCSENTYDVIGFKSVLGGIGRGDNYGKIEDAIARIYRSLKPGGILVFAENLAGSFLHKLARRVLGEGRRSWRYIHYHEAGSLFAGFDKVDLKTFGVLGLAGRTERMHSLFSIIDEHILERCVAVESRYIVAGVAIK